MDLPPYTCTNQETAGIAEFFDAAENYVTALTSSRCFADWYCLYIGSGLTWRWRGGVDPDDPSTWPAPPEDPAPSPPQEPTIQPA